MNILNEMFKYTDNEVKRLEELNTSLKEATQQMYRDFNNLYQGRLKTQGMEVYNNQTWFESRMSFNFYGNNSIIKMSEDQYYCSQFDKMLELLCAEEENLSYQGCVCAYKELKLSGKMANADKENNICDALDDGGSWADWMNHPKIEHINICHAEHDIFDHHLYSIPDMLRMNSFKIKMVMKQEREFNITN